MAVYLIVINIIETIAFFIVIVVVVHHRSLLSLEKKLMSLSHSFQMPHRYIL